MTVGRAIERMGIGLLAVNCWRGVATRSLDEAAL